MDHRESWTFFAGLDDHEGQPYATGRHLHEFSGWSS